MRSRVMPGSLVTIARRVPVKRLKSVDLPTLGRPTMTRDGSRSAMSSRAGHTTSAAAGCVIFQCSAFKAWLKVRGCGGSLLVVWFGSGGGEFDGLAVGRVTGGLRLKPRPRGGDGEKGAWQETLFSQK